MYDNIMWVEKYRPSKMSEIVNQKEIIHSLISFCKKEGELPHLLFSGSAGIGKTTTALCVVKEILGENWRDFTLELNASDERGINMVRERIKKFSRFSGLSVDIPFKMIILDEADEMTSDAQTALRRIIEDASRYCRFILIANNVSKIIEPLQSRCAVFKFTKILSVDLIAHLRVVSKNENIKNDEEGLKMIADYVNGDLRHAINILQATSSIGGINKKNVKTVLGLTKTNEVETILTLALGGKILQARNKMIELIKVHGMSEIDFLKFMNQAVFKIKINNLNKIITTIAKYDYRVLVGANPEIQLTALLSELSTLNDAERGI